VFHSVLTVLHSLLCFSSLRDSLFPLWDSVVLGSQCCTVFSQCCTVFCAFLLCETLCFLCGTLWCLVHSVAWCTQRVAQSFVLFFSVRLCVSSVGLCGAWFTVLHGARKELHSVFFFVKSLFNQSKAQLFLCRSLNF
jgi:hypothetical protein